MSVWIFAAVQSEMDRILRDLRADKRAPVAGYQCFEGRLGTLSIRLGVVGVGPVSSGISIGAFLTLAPCEMAIMLGSAGALPSFGLNVGDLVVAESETLAELGVLTGPGIGDVGPLNLLELAQEIPFDLNLRAALTESAGAAGPVRVGKLLTVEGVSALPEQARARAERFKALAENMEGYALALAGLRFGIPTAEVRGVSNMAGDRDKVKWDLPSAGRRAQEVVLQFLKRLI